MPQSDIMEIWPELAKYGLGVLALIWFLKYLMDQNKALIAKTDADNAWKVQIIQNDTIATQAATMAQMKMTETLQKVADNLAAIERKLS